MKRNLGLQNEWKNPTINTEILNPWVLKDATQDSVLFLLLSYQENNMLL